MHYRWDLRFKHIRLVLPSQRWIRFRMIVHDLDELLSLPIVRKADHVYMSVLNFASPEIVGKKYTAKWTLPIGGEFLVAP